MFTKELLLEDNKKKRNKNSLIIAMKLAAERLRGEFSIVTPFNAYWVRLLNNRLIDAAPVLRNRHMKEDFRTLLNGILQNEGSYQFYGLSR